MKLPSDLLGNADFGGIGCLPHRPVNFMLQRIAIEQIITLCLYLESLVENLVGRGGCVETSKR